MTNVVVVGGGISGLATAYRLQQLLPAARITVLEQGDRPGGTVWTEQRDGFRVEVGANGFLDTKSSTLALCQELGLGDQLVPASESAGRNRYLFWEGKLQPLPGGFRAFLGSRLLSWRGKLRLLTEPFRRRRPLGPDESVDAFARRRAGSEAAEVLADALVTGIHAGDSALLSARAAFPRLCAFEEQYGSVFKGMAAAARQRRAEGAAGGAKMWSFRDGLRLLIETLQGRLREPPCLGAAVTRIEQTAADHTRWTVYGEGQDRWTAHAVVLACPAHRQAAIVHDLDRELADHIAGIVYSKVAVVAVAYRRADVPGDLAGFGYIAPQRTRRDVLGVQWCSSIFPGRAPEGTVLLRAMCGGWHRPEVVGWDDRTLVAAVRRDLDAAMSITAAPLFQHVVRWDHAIPQYHLQHLERVAWIEARAGGHPGLFLSGNAYHGVALNDCTEQAGLVAARVGRYLQGAAANS
ncbi:MAG TPA: protoporphyrinogen oxidase [Gemmataceae bacterium]|nr:protoporphyrinogen oxidase [Gemmataceae bacterium]